MPSRTQTIPIQNRENERVRDERRTSDAQTKTHEVVPWCARLVRQLRCQREPREQEISKSRGEGLEIEDVRELGEGAVFIAVCDSDTPGTIRVEGRCRITVDVDEVER